MTSLQYCTHNLRQVGHIYKNNYAPPKKYLYSHSTDYAYCALGTVRTVEEAEIRCKSFKRVVEYNKMTQNFIYEYVFIRMFTQSPQ